MRPVEADGTDGYEGDLPVRHLDDGSIESIWAFEPSEARRWNKEGDLLVNLQQWPDGSVRMFLSHQRIRKGVKA